MHAFDDAHPMSHRTRSRSDAEADHDRMHHRPQDCVLTETNPNAAEALCEYACYYTDADKQQHHTSTANGIVRPRKKTDGMGRVDGEPLYTNISTKGSCTLWKCQTNSRGQLVCSSN